MLATNSGAPQTRQCYTSLMGNLGGQEIFWIILIVALLFGATRIPQLMKGFGQGIREFKQAVKEDDTSKPESPVKTNGDTPAKG